MPITGPGDIANLTCDIDPDFCTPDDAPDQSGQSHSFIGENLISGDHRPSVPAGVLNGHAVVDFDQSTEDYYTIPRLGGVGPGLEWNLEDIYSYTGWTTFITCKVRSILSSSTGDHTVMDGIWGRTSTDAIDVQFQKTPQKLRIWYPGDTFGVAEGYGYELFTGLDLGQWELITLWYDNPILQLYTMRYPTLQLIDVGLTVAGLLNHNAGGRLGWGDAPADAQLARFTTYNRALTCDERWEYENWARLRFGFPTVPNPCGGRRMYTTLVGA